MRRPNSKFMDMDTSGAGFFSNAWHLKLLDPIASHRPSESSTSHSIVLSAFPVLSPVSALGFGICIWHLKSRLIQFFLFSSTFFYFIPLSSLILVMAYPPTFFPACSSWHLLPVCDRVPLTPYRLIDHRETFVSSENKFTRTRFHLSITVKTSLTHPTF